MSEKCPLCQKWIDALDDAMHRLEVQGEKLAQAKAEKGRLGRLLERLRLAADTMVRAFPDEATDQEFNIPYCVREELREAATAAEASQ